MLYRHQIAEQVTKAIPELEPFASIIIKIDPWKEGNGHAWIEANKGQLTNIDALRILAEKLSTMYNEIGDFISETNWGDDKFHNNGSSLDLMESYEDFLGANSSHFITELAYMAGLTQKHPVPENEEDLDYLKKYHGVLAATICNKDTY